MTALAAGHARAVQMLPQKGTIKVSLHSAPKINHLQHVDVVRPSVWASVVCPTTRARACVGAFSHISRQRQNQDRPGAARHGPKVPNKAQINKASGATVSLLAKSMASFLCLGGSAQRARVSRASAHMSYDTVWPLDCTRTVAVYSVLLSFLFFTLTPYSFGIAITFNRFFTCTVLVLVGGVAWSTFVS
jgi:hypothetical protein